MKSDTMKSDGMKSDKMSRGRGTQMSGGNREHVKAAQQALKDKGHDPGAIDGVMGPKTRSALKDFQKKEGIKDTGRLDQETMGKLGMDAKMSSAGGAASGSASPSTSTSSPPSGGSSPSASPGSSNSAGADKKSETDKK
jgi:peptidoglycan hydrolase-like protein with peptidoglycan-binding domain